jgi:hypothetical protein
MSNDDYRDVPRENSEVRRLATKLREHFGIATAEHVDVLGCASRGSIWTIRGVKPLRLEVASDDQMPNDVGLTSYDGNTIVIHIPRRIRHAAFLGDGFARNTIGHEFGHAVMHFEKLTQGAVMARRSAKNITPSWLPPYESAEHHAKVFAPAFLINETIAQSIKSIDEISVTFGISRKSAEIYFEQLQAEKDRSAIAARVRLKANKAIEAINSIGPKPKELTFLTDCCSVCTKQTLFPVGLKFMCQNCDTIYDRFQDGDQAQ